eukprot:2073357-Pyramimonas_sp.AAC.1
MGWPVGCPAGCPVGCPVRCRVGCSADCFVASRQAIAAARKTKQLLSPTQPPYHQKGCLPGN